MNFNKDYPIAILDTNIVMDFPNILEILKGCNIVIPYTLIDELDKLKKEKKGARDFVNNFLALSEKANLSKDGYKLENDCMLYLDIYKDNSHHKDINLDSKKEDIKFIAEAKNLKEKYNDMAVVLLTSDKIMKITASAFDVKAKNLEEFLEEYLKVGINGLYELAKKYDYYYKIIFNSLLKNKDIDGLYELVKNNDYNNVCINKITKIRELEEIGGLRSFLDKDELDNLFELYNLFLDKKDIYKAIIKILSDNKDIEEVKNLMKIISREFNLWC